MTRRTTLVLSVGLLCFGCSASPKINVGNEPDGSVAGSGGASGSAGLGGFGGGDNTLTALITEPPSEMAIEVITVSCAGECKQVLAVVSGGNDPYTFAWNDGVTTAAREICADDDTSFTVTVTDTAIVDGEFPYGGQSVVASVEVRLLSCPSDGGVDAGTTQALIVPGIADLWLAGQPDGFMITHPEGGADVAPLNSPVQVPLSDATRLSFSVTGATSNSPIPCGGTPDGACSFGIPSTAPATNALSGLTAPFNSLIGVFLDDTVPTGPVPTTLDATATAGLAALAPELRQPFFIGDGLTGNGTGTVQRVSVPAGATRLCLGSHDAAGGNYNNSGQFEVTVTSTP